MKHYIFSPLSAIFSLVLAAVMLGCGDDADRLPCLTCGQNSMCGDSWYDASTEFCYGTTAVYSRCGGRVFTPSMEFCYESYIYNKCNGYDYSPLIQFCYNSSVYEKCGGNDYNPSTQFCSGNVIYDKCGGNDYYPSTKFCYGNILYDKCGYYSSYNSYNPSTQFCSSSTIYDKCGGTIVFVPVTEQCCGSSKYTTSTQFCSGGSIYNKCGSSEYNPSTKFCYNNAIYDKCGGTLTFSPATELCCGNSKYTTSTEFCSAGSIYRKCGTWDFDPATELCCGSNKYAISTQRCGSNNVVETICGTNSWYNSSTQFCADNTVYNKCGSSNYTPSTQYCSNGTVRTYGSLPYDKTYKTVLIGTQTWMAENLNYAAEGSVCYDNQDNNCVKYGRLYDWSTAMALPSKCNSTLSTADSDCGITTPKHKGICPTNWHIPSDAEWTTLTNSVSTNAGTKLKATSGWNYFSGVPSGSDTYGFAALPGGYGTSDGNFSYAGDNGLWWSSSENGAYYAYYRYMDYGEGVYRDGISKSYLRSVRCLQD